MAIIIPPVDESIDAAISQYDNRYVFWQALEVLIAEYRNTVKRFDVVGFKNFVSDNYGITIELSGGFVDYYYQITDEQKYMLYVLKFS